MLEHVFAQLSPSPSSLCPSLSNLQTGWILCTSGACASLVCCVFVCMCTSHWVVCWSWSSFSVGRRWLGWCEGDEMGCPPPHHHTWDFSSFCMHIFRKCCCSSVTSPLPVGMADVITLPLLTHPTPTPGELLVTLWNQENRVLGSHPLWLSPVGLRTQAPQIGAHTFWWVCISMYVCMALSVITNIILAIWTSVCPVAGGCHVNR